jgi:glycine cleavage system aminomethyltransferase T
MVFYPHAARAQVGAQVGGSALVTDATAAYTVLALTGPDARALLARLTHLHHFPSGGEIAHVTGHVLPAGRGYRVVVAQELGHYVAEVALDCATALGGGLVGVDALPAEETA